MGKVIEFRRKYKGIFITSIEYIYDVPGDVFLFCTTYSKDAPDGTYIAKELSPSFNLLFKKKMWLDKGIFRDRFDEYRKLYLEELKQREDTREYIEKLKGIIEEGKEVVLFDNCYLKKYCHLNILKQYLEKEYNFKIQVQPKYFYGLSGRK